MRCARCNSATNSLTAHTNGDNLCVFYLGCVTRHTVTEESVKAYHVGLYDIKFRGLDGKFVKLEDYQRDIDKRDEIIKELGIYDKEH